MLPPLDELTSSGLLRRWRYNALGWPVCTFDAVDPSRLTPEEVAEIKAINAEIREMEAAILAVVDARGRLLFLGEEHPPRYETYIDEAGEERRRETEAYKTWKHDKDLLANVDPDVQALIDLREQRYPEDGNGGFLVPVDEPGDDPYPHGLPAEGVPAEVSDRQLAQMFAEMGEIPWEEAHAWGEEGKIPARLMSAIALIPDEISRNRARMHLGSATIFRRNHPMTVALGKALGWTPDQLDALWKAAAQL